MRVSVLSCLFPETVAVADRRFPGDIADLLPAELHYVARAHQKRIQDFAGGRACARQALAQLGVAEVAIAAATDRQPVWPAGYVGSITHTRGLCAAAVAAQRDVVALGLDSEIVGAPGSELWPTLCTATELSWVGSLAGAEQAAAVTLVFSAKEAFYKCQYPSTGEWLDFHDVGITVEGWGEISCRFQVVPVRATRFTGVNGYPIVGRYLFHENFVSTAITVPVDQ